MSEVSEGTEASQPISNQLASLVPTFDPSKDDLQVYSQKVSLLLDAWPVGRYTELATRLILNCSGSAFKKLQLHQSEITVNEKKSIQRIVELLGGHWGQIDLEQKYEHAERALYRCQQKNDESADSYLARADIMWTELNNRSLKLGDLQAYVTLRGSTLTAEDKKRVLVDADVTDGGSLTIKRVGASIRMLGAGFFQEMTQGKRNVKLKTYDQTALVADTPESEEYPENFTFATDNPEEDEQWVDVLAQEGDEDAALVSDFESAAADLLQSDEELASACTAYTEARRRLNEKVRSRGFWPLQSKGKFKGSSKGVKGKFNKGHSSSRKSLQQRILESRCRLCGKMGHWKAECPSKSDAAGSAPNRSPQAPTSFAQGISMEAAVDDLNALPLEFLNLPMSEQVTLDASQHDMNQYVFAVTVEDNPKRKLSQTLNQWKKSQATFSNRARNDDEMHKARERIRDRLAQHRASPTEPDVQTCETAPVCFATHGSYGVVDLGATKTVIGSQKVGELINSLDPHVRKQVTRCECNITFRFGNHGVLQSKQALVVPIYGLQLKIAIVPGATPFLLSNTLLRAIGAVIDTGRKVLHSSRIGRAIPLVLTGKGLFLLDLNELACSPNDQCSKFSEAETHNVECPEPALSTLDKDVTKPAADPPTSHMKDTCPCHEVGVMKHDHTMVEKTPMSTTNKVEVSGKRSVSANAVNSKPGLASECQCVTTATGRSKAPNAETTPGDSVCNGTVQETPASAGDRRTDCPGLFQVVNGGSGSLSDRLRTSSEGQELCPGMERSPGLGNMVRAALREVQQTSPSEVPTLCHPEGREGRIDETKDSSGRQCGGSQEDPADPPDPKDQGQSQGSIFGQDRGNSMSLGRCGRSEHLRDDRHGGDRRSASVGAFVAKHVSAGGPSGQHGECHVTGDGILGTESRGSAEQQLREPDCPSLAARITAGDVSADCLVTETSAPETNQERMIFNKLVHRYTQELEDVIRNSTGVNNKQKSLDVLEIFCGPQSQLTHQCQQLKFQAARFGYQQGDLQTEAGRRDMFTQLVCRQPKHVWASPTCGPWSGFSTLNGSRSMTAWDELQAFRKRHIEQIALCVVVFRYQRSHLRHFHWEQPRGSLMFKLPYLQELLHYLLATDVDLCTAGDLRDPVNGLHIRKGLTIMTSSSHMHQVLSQFRCQGQHDHQVIEGQVRYHGETINRSQFTENYPRKFARRIAQIMCRVKTMKENPYRSHECQVFAADHPEMPASKRARLSQTYRPKLSRARGVDALPWGKRTKTTGKTTPLDARALWGQVFDKLRSILPRVGKTEIHDQGILTEIKNLVTDKDIRSVIACRGCSRTIAPPKNMILGEAPFRKSVFIDRQSGDIRAEEEWESWETLAKRNLIRPSHPCSINITMFARTNSESLNTNTRVSTPSDAEPAVDRPQLHEPENSSNPGAIVDNEVCPNSAFQPGICKDSYVTTKLTPSQTEDLRSPEQSQRFKALSPEERSMIIRAHKNFGHPSPERLSTLLKSQGFRSEVAQGALDLRCSVCQSQTQPKLAKPSTIRDELDFNDRVCVDGLEWTNKQGTKFHLYHVVDWATSFQTACCAPDSSTAGFLQGFMQMWLSWAGAPAEMIVDAGTEFNSEEFSEFTQSHNIKVTTISTEAPFQNGKAERHGAIVKTMLSKYEAEHPINNYQDLREALWWCIQAKNACSLRKVYAPEVLVLGKHTRIPGAICSDELLPAHLLADSETAHGIQFRKQLSCRESARKAYHQADNDAALRRALLRRSRPGQQAYHPGEWVMVWRPGKGNAAGFWSGPMKVVVQENQQTIWTTSASKLFRSAPENVRPVTASETHDIPMMPNEPSISVIAQQLPNITQQGITRAVNLDPGNIPSHVTELDNFNPPNHNPNPESNQSNQSEGQPDQEPEIPHSQGPRSQEGGSTVDGSTPPEIPVVDPAVETPIPDEDDDDDLVCEGLYCQDEDPCMLTDSLDLAWRLEIDVNHQDLQDWKSEQDKSEMAFLVSAAKRQRAEVKMSSLNASEKEEFQKAKEVEIQNWIKTGTVSKILREKIPYDQVLRCRWILTWKNVDMSPTEYTKDAKRVKAKARLVILGYLDPQLEELPRDSPTLGRNTKMLLLQMIASQGWDLRSFDIKAAFLQG